MLDNLLHDGKALHSTINDDSIHAMRSLIRQVIYLHCRVQYQVLVPRAPIHAVDQDDPHFQSRHVKTSFTC